MQHNTGQYIAYSRNGDGTGSPRLLRFVLYIVLDESRQPKIGNIGIIMYSIYLDRSF
jgi:hypothetical protein